MSLHAERAYFDGDHCQHCADREEQVRLDMKREKARQLATAQAEIARFPTLSNPLPKAQVPQFVRSMDALFEQARLVKQMKEMGK